jgi:hypothetical protein
VEIMGNTVTYASMYLEGGSQNRQPCSGDEAGGICKLSGGFLELAAYGGAEDRPGPRPTVIATDNVLRGPSGAVSGGYDVALRGGRRGSLQLERLDANFDWKMLEER